jgi:hypothetical protein
VKSAHRILKVAPKKFFDSWRYVKGRALADRKTRSIEESAQRACRYIFDLSPRERLKKAGVLSGNFWLLADKINRLSKNFFSFTYVKKSCETMKRSCFILKKSKPFYVALLLWLNLNNPRLELLLLQERIVAYPLRYLF